MAVRVVTDARTRAGRTGTPRSQAIAREMSVWSHSCAKRDGASYEFGNVSSHKRNKVAYFDDCGPRYLVAPSKSRCLRLPCPTKGHKKVGSKKGRMMKK